MNCPHCQSKYFGPVEEVIRADKWYKPDKSIYRCADYGEKVKKVTNTKFRLMGSLSLFLAVVVIPYLMRNFEHDSFIFGVLVITAMIALIFHLVTIMLAKYEKPDN